MSQFPILFTLTTLHEYYGSPLQDFRFIVPSDTQRLLKNGKLLSRIKDGVFHLLYETNDSGQARSPIQGETVRIGLQVGDPFFGNYTSLPFDPRIVTPLYRNTVTSNTLDALQETFFVGKRFSHILTDSARPVTVRIFHPAGHMLDTEQSGPFEITTDHDRATISYNLAEEPAGKFTVEEQYSGSTISRDYYSDAELAQQGVFGIVEIQVDSGFYTTPPNFQISFTAKQDTLNYYVLAKNYSEGDLAQLTVTDAGFMEQSRTQVTFSKIPVTNWTNQELAPSLFDQQGAKLVLFRSQAPLARQEPTRKKIQLNKNGENLITNLPQPRSCHPNGDLIIHLSKPEL